MLTAYRRHLKSCHGRKVCRGCPVWVNGMLDGVFIRQSLRTRNWEAAQKRVREMEVSGIVEVAPISMKDACERFIEDCKARNLKPASLAKYELLTRELKWELSGPLKAVSRADLGRYQASWKLCPESRLYKLSRLKKFFRFCLENGWIKENPARNLSRPIFERKEAIPFTEEQLEKIMWSLELYPDEPKGRRDLVRAFVLMLRWTGLRIGDVVNMRWENIREGKLNLRTGKTGSVVWLPLKNEVLASVKTIPPVSQFIFRSGNGTLKSAISSWHRSMGTLFKIAGIEGCGVHRFRHTLCCELLSKNVSVENVAAILGNTPAIVLKHYSHWIRSRQAALEEAIGKAWKV